MSKKPFNVELTEEERGKLEAHRARLGLRSQADVIRQWIAEQPSGLTYTTKEAVEVARRMGATPEEMAALSVAEPGKVVTVQNRTPRTITLGTPPKLTPPSVPYGQRLKKGKAP